MYQNKWLFCFIYFQLLFTSFLNSESDISKHRNAKDLFVTENGESDVDDFIKYNNITCGIRNNYEFSRIIGGTVVQLGEFPWLVSIQYYGNKKSVHLCGGAIIEPNWILTAAHCVIKQQKENLRVIAGEYRLDSFDGTEQFRKVLRVILYNNDSTSLFAHDIALLKLETKLIFDPKYVAPICLPRKNEEFQSTATIAGWGKESTNNKNMSNTLRLANLQFVSSKRCRRVHGRIGIDEYFNGCQICAGVQKGEVDACQGDSGGPLICKNVTNKRYYICGIVSWGVGCGDPAYPGVYTKVSCYTDWILDIINGNNS